MYSPNFGTTNLCILDISQEEEEEWKEAWLSGCLSLDARTQQVSWLLMLPTTPATIIF